MAVTSSNEIRYRTSIEEDGTRTYGITYLVQVDDPDTSPILVRNSVGWDLWDVHSDDAKAYVTSKTAEQTSDDGLTWEVNVSFGYIERPESPIGKVTYSWSQGSKPTAIDYDIAGNAIVNSVGDPFLESIEKESKFPVLTITRNEITSPQAYMSYTNCVNADTFLTWPAGTVRINGVSGDQQTDPEYGDYWVNRYEFEFRPGGYTLSLLDQGLRAKDGDGKVKHIVGADLEEVTEPVLLNGEGKELNPLVDGVRPDEENLNPPVRLTFTIYPSVPFAALGF